MFCPQCRAEYREGFHKCSDCNINLVRELPPEEEPEFIDYREVLGTYNPADVALIKSLLDAEKVTYFFKGEHFMYVRPLVDPVRLMVKEDEVSYAKDVLKDLKLSYIAINLDEKSK